MACDRQHFSYLGSVTSIKLSVESVDVGKIYGYANVASHGLSWKANLRPCTYVHCLASVALSLTLQSYQPK